MCATCGCGNEAGARLTLLQGIVGDEELVHSGHSHSYSEQPYDGHSGYDHPYGEHSHTVIDFHHHHDHLDGHDQFEAVEDHDMSGSTVVLEQSGSTVVLEQSGSTVVLEQQILAKNTSIAQDNRAWLAGRRVFAINLMSSPGAGKTTLLERTIAGFGDRAAIAVIEGDQETPFDAERIRASGRPVVQINTGAGCHLDAAMVQRAMHALDPGPGALLFIENVGNLVCPALFDLGENKRVVLTSVTEGADKPLKYPHMFRVADLVLINKMDLHPYVDFDVDRFSADARRLNPAADLLSVSAIKNSGLSEWFNWLTATLPA